MQGRAFGARMRERVRLELHPSDWLSSIRGMLSSIFEVQGSRSQAMEGLRGFSAFLVFGVHWAALFSRHIQPSSTLMAFTAFWANIGHLGVDIFFVLSGYLIYGVAMKGGSYAAFMRRRAQRIYPVFLCVYAAYAISAPFIGVARMPRGAGASALYHLQNLLLMPGVFKVPPLISAAWSLSYEMAFYLALPLMAFALRRMRFPTP